MKNKNYLNLIILVLLLLLFFSFSVIASTLKWQPELNLEGRIEEADLGYIGRAGILFPLKQGKDSLYYTDVRGMFAEDDILEANLGAGYRQLSRKKNWIIGGYCFRDWRQEYNESWQQWTLGAESMTDKYDFRINGYFPAAGEVLASNLPSDEILVMGNNVVYEEAQEKSYYQPMDGYDIEVGRRFSKDLPFEVGIYLRKFKFYGDNMISLEGEGISLNTVFGDHREALLNIGLDWQDDNIRGSRTELSFGVTIPLGKDSKETKGNEVEDKNNEPNESRDKSNEETIIKSQKFLMQKMVEPARRDINVVIGETEPSRKVIDKVTAADPETGEEIEKIWYVTAEGKGKGTRDDPTNLRELGDSGEGDMIVAEENDVIVVLGDDGPINTGQYSVNENNLSLLSGQKLLSPGGHMFFAHEQKDRQAVFFPEGLQATLKNDSEHNILELAGDNTVSGIRFAQGKNAIYGDIISGNLRITDNIILDTAQNGIFITAKNVKSAVVSDNIIEKTGGYGISMGLTDIPNLPEGVEFLGSQNLTESISQVRSLDNSSAINLSSETDLPLNLEVSGNQIGESVLNAIFIYTGLQNNSNLSISENIVSETEGSGIVINSLAGGEINLDVVGNNIKKAEHFGIFVEEMTEDNVRINCKDNSTGTASRGLYFSGGAGNFQGDFTDNYINTARKDSAIALRFATTGESDTFIRNNQVDLAPMGINIEIASEEDNIIKVSNNLIKKADSGLAVTAQSSTDLETIIKENKIENAISIGIGAMTNGIQENKTIITNNELSESNGPGIKVISGSSGDNYTAVSSNKLGNIAIDAIDVKTQGSNNTTVIEKNSIDYAGNRGITAQVQTMERGNLNISNNILEKTEKEGVNVDIQKIEGLKAVDVDIKDNVINTSADDGISVNMGQPASSINISGNQIDSSDKCGISIFASNASDIKAVVSDNVVNSAAEYAVSLIADGSSSLTGLIENNKSAQNEILLKADDTESILKAEISDNNFADLEKAGGGNITVTGGTGEKSTTR